MGDLEYFNLIDDTWYFPTVYTKSILPLRRNHIAETFSNFMIIQGGLNDEGSFLNDTYIFNYIQLKWLELTIDDSLEFPYAAYHAACFILPKELKNTTKLSIYKLPDNYRRSLEAYYGLLIFGGKNRYNKETNELWLLKIGMKPLEWKPLHLTVKGKPPRERYLHTMTYYEERQMVIIHGGRNDNYDPDYFSLNDTYILDFNNRDPTRIEVKILSIYNNFSILNRCSHSAFMIYDKLVIFGGYNEEYYIGSHLFIINLDFKKADNEMEALKNEIKELKYGFKNPKVERYNELKAKTKPIAIVESFKLPYFK